jgi:hypothetical protein
VPGGTFIHSAVALAPHAYILALEGIAVVVRWVAASRRTWHEERATRVFTAGAVTMTLLVAAGTAAVTYANWVERRHDFRLVAEDLAAAGAAPAERVMSIDAAGTLYWAGHPGVVLVNDPLPTIEEVARAYDIRWLVLTRADTVAAVAPILDGGPRPLWIGPPVAHRPARQPDGAEPLPEGAVDVAVFPVCSAPDDPRCADPED